MAVKTLEEVLGSLSADEKKVLENTLSKNPELKEGWLRQDDYSRKSNELKTEREKLTEKLEYADKMEAWSEVNVPRYNALVEQGIISEDGEELWTSQKADLERQLEEARNAAVGGDMKPEELDARVREIIKATGTALTKEETAALYASQAKEVAETTFSEQWKTKETDFNEKTIPFVAGFSAANAIAAMEYQTKTGKPWTAETQKEFNALMEREKNFNPFEVKELFLKPFQAEKDTEAEIERRATEKAEELAKQRGLMPGAGGETYIPQGEVGNLKSMLDRSAGEGDFESNIRAQAVKAAAELRTEGK